MTPSLDATHPDESHRDEAYCSACSRSFALDTDVCPHDGARLTKLKAQPDSFLGRIFDARYEVRTPIGRGAMGTVYRGWQLSVDREVAIKVIHPRLASDRTAVKRFLREVRLSSRLSQPNIVNVYDSGQTDDGVLFLVMELLRGHTLARELDGMRPLPLRRVTTIATQLCDALDSAHGQDIVHRDLKPGNIVILDDPPGRDLVKVLDFGLAKSLVADQSSVVTATSAILGTPLYMAPEQIDGKSVDPRTDLYALGCLVFQMLTGRPPFLGENTNIVLAMHLAEPPPPLPAHVPPVLAQMVRQLMEKDPARRPASAAVVREAIRTAVEGGYASELSDTTPEIRTSQPSMPLELAMTDAAHDRRPITDQYAALAQSAPVLATPPSRRRWLAPVVVGVLGLGGGAAYLATRDGGVHVRPMAVPTDAARADATVAVDAAVVLVDAGVEPDGALARPDAGGKPRPRPPPPPKPRGIDAGVTEPSLDFIKPTR